MRDFVIEENIRRFERLLDETVDDSQRKVVAGLLDAEKGKLAALRGPAIRP